MNELNKIRVLLVDDHLVVRAGIWHVLGSVPSVVIIGEAGNGVDAIRMAQELQPDIVIMDVKLTGMSGIEATAVITRANPDIRVLALSTFAQPEEVNLMLKAGAKGYLLKDVSAQELEQSIWRVHQGEQLSLDPRIDNAGHPRRRTSNKRCI